LALFGRADLTKSFDPADVGAAISVGAALIAEQSAEITELVRASVAALTGSADAASPEARQCLVYVMSIIVDSFRNNILFSSTHFSAISRPPTPPPSR
jgi:hypothetical protein